MTRSNSEIRELDIEVLNIVAGGMRFLDLFPVCNSIFQGPLIGTAIGGAIGGIANDGDEASSRQAKAAPVIRRA